MLQRMSRPTSPPSSENSERSGESRSNCQLPMSTEQDGPAESSIRVLACYTRSVLEGTGLPVPTWFSSMTSTNVAFSAKWTIQTNSTPYFDLMGENQDVYESCRLRCEAYVYLKPQRWEERGKFEPLAVKGVISGLRLTGTRGSISFVKHYLCHQPGQVH